MSIGTDAYMRVVVSVATQAQCGRVVVGGAIANTDSQHRPMSVAMLQIVIL